MYGENSNVINERINNEMKINNQSAKSGNNEIIIGVMK